MRSHHSQSAVSGLRKILRFARGAASKTGWAVMGLLPAAALYNLADSSLRIRRKLHELARRQRARRHPCIEPAITSINGQRLHRSILESNNSWKDIQLPKVQTPGMLSESEKRYYVYIADYYRSIGDVVEIGPWLGLSTRYIAYGLNANPHFKDKRLYVFDDFTWRSDWMDKWLVDTGIEPPAQHASFQHLFEAQTRDISHLLCTTRAKLIDHDGNENLSAVCWEGGPIELIIVDCGRRLAVNDAWYSVFSPHFINDKTLVVLQDWQNHKRVPEVYWENMRLFTDSKESALELIHEIPYACLATFLYRG